MRRITLALFTALTFGSSLAAAQTLVTYDADIINSFGTHRTLFPAGQRVVISYVLDARPDTNSNPNRGEFRNTVAAMWVSFPGLGIYANAGPPNASYTGDVFTLNNIVSGSQSADTMYVNSGPITSDSRLNGNRVQHMEIEFGDFVSLPANPSMLTSDALPLRPLVSPYSYLHIWSEGGGLTTVRFGPRVPPVTLTYSGVITWSFGVNEALFPEGERIRVAYTVAPNAVDTDPLPGSARYLNGSLSIAVTFPDLGLYANAGPPRGPYDSDVYTVNDGSLSSGALTDQVTLFGGRLGSSSLLNGEPLTWLVLGFHDFPDAPASSFMLSSDALPTHRLWSSDSYVLLQTASGNTFVKYDLAPTDRLGILIEHVNRFVVEGRLTMEAAAPLTRTLDNARRSLLKGNTSAACGYLNSFINQVQEAVGAGALPPAIGEFLVGRAEVLREQVGC
jgi:hypothetical protein